MPELPEVETIRRGLEKYVVGYTIQSVEIKRPKLFQGNAKDIEGATIEKIERFGKGLVIGLSNGYSLAIHIKLTGQLIYQNEELRIKNKGDRTREEHLSGQMVASGYDKAEGRVEVPSKATCVVFGLGNCHPERSEGPQFKNREMLNQVQHDDKRDSSAAPQNDNCALYYNDIRQFGWIKVVKTDQVQSLPFFKELGPEFPLVKKDSNLTIQQFNNLLSSSKTPVKVLLMDQKKMSGVGNIYANDALYLAKINPKRSANSLSAAEIKTLYDAILTVLKKGLEEGGASELTFVNVLGEPGNYQNHTLIYGHQGEKCKRDGTVIVKYMLGGRGTYVCNTCQK